MEGKKLMDWGTEAAGLPFTPGPGDEVVVKVEPGGSSRDVVDELRQNHGFTAISDNCEEEVVLLRFGEEATEAEEEDVPEQSSTVESEFFSAPIPGQVVFKSGPSDSPVVVWQWSNSLAKVEQSFQVNVDGSEQHPYAAAFFRSACSRESGRLRLYLESIYFGVEDCRDTAESRGYFVYQVDIEAMPVHAWVALCSMFGALPDNSKSDPVQLQNSKGQSIQVGINPKNVVLGMNTARTKGQSKHKHAWRAAKLLPSTKSVRWTWAISLWDDCQAFNYNNPAKFDWGTIPKLPCEEPDSVHFMDPGVEATWEMPITELQNMTDIAWDVKLTMHTAYIQQKGFWKLAFHRPKVRKERFTISCNNLRMMI